MKNLKMATRILQQCATWGVKTFCVCPGGRNAPLIELLGKMSGVEVFTFFDERTAGFYGLGKARQTGRPVAVITTSGTAVCELLSPMVEAFYSRIPLLAITADRPQCYRQTGAPQVIEQAGIFADYVEASFDFDTDDFVAIEWQQNYGLHINLCFAEPLLDGDLPVIDYKDSLASHPPRQSRAADEPSVVDRWLRDHRVTRPLVVVGELVGGEGAALQAILQRYECPLYLEGPSGLREAPALQTYRISDERYVGQLLQRGYFDGILRFGGVPTAKFWRDMENYKVPSIAISHRPFSGHPQTLLVHELVANQYQHPPVKLGFSCQEVLAEGRQRERQIHLLLDEFPHSETTWVRQISRSLPANSQVYVGNSLPIREWDLVAQPRQEKKVFCNRGANGIDGQLATALGISVPDSPTWAVLGDLTFFYDSSALSLQHQLGQRDFNLFVINNQGGQIFADMFTSPLFVNPQQVQLGELARAYYWHYELMENPGHFSPPRSGLNVIEIKPSLAQSQQFWHAYRGLWKS